MIHKTFLRLAFLLSFVFYAAGSVRAQDNRKIEIEIIPSKPDWRAQRGENIHFDILVKQGGKALKSDSVYYEIGPEMITPFSKGYIKQFKGKFESPEYTLHEPGFIRCIVRVRVEGKDIQKMATVGFEPELIQPTQEVPLDFDVFWDNAIRESKQIPLQIKKTYLLERSTADISVFEVAIDHINNSKIYGILTMPKATGKYPAILRVPGAGVRPYGPDIELANKGFIVLNIGIHGISVTMDSIVYKDLATGALRQYYNNNIHNKDEFYYKRVYLGCLKANDFLTSLTEWNGQDLVVTGGSQGGALSIVTAALDKRVTAMAALYPALSDLTGYLHQRAGGWPHYFSAGSYSKIASIPNVQDNLSYYDVVNFARKIQVPSLLTWGFNDTVCPPTSMYASYNIMTAPKHLSIYKEMGHWTHPDQKQEVNTWIQNITK